MAQKEYQKGITPPATNALPGDLGERYRNMDRQLLADQLIQLGLFGTLKTPEDVARHNYAVELLRDCEIIDHENGKITIESMSKAIGNLLATVNAKET